MSSTSFDFKQFTIHQDRCAMKVGTDGVLLGAWAQADQPRRLLDIGAGTGLISLMLAQRFAQADITAVEIDSLAARQCLENFAASPWPDRLHILPQSLAEAEPALGMFDGIVSNPPFYNATLKPDDPGRAVARHKDSLPIDEIAAFAQRHLAPHGSLSLIYPTAYDSEVMTACILHQLQPLRICDVLTKQGKPCKRRMASFAFLHSQTAATPLFREQLSIRNSEGEYSEQYLELVNDFYLSLK